MIHRALVIAFVAATLAATGCSKKSDDNKDNKPAPAKATKAPAKPAAKPAPKVQAPPDAPTMPPEWKVTEDVAFSAKDIARVAKTLGAPVVALRNTTYLVNGKRIKINLIVAPDKTAADALEKRLNTMKPAEFSFRMGNVLYEFVGTDAALPEIRAASALLQKAK